LKVLFDAHRGKILAPARNRFGILSVPVAACMCLCPLSGLASTAATAAFADDLRTWQYNHLK
jgi:hypothetical protein